MNEMRLLSSTMLWNKKRMWSRCFFSHLPQSVTLSAGFLLKLDKQGVDLPGTRKPASNILPSQQY